jgi:hypothetical protein
MRYLATLVLSSCLLVAAAPVAADPVLDCSRRSLADAVDRAHERDLVIAFTGVCNGPIVIKTDGLTLRGVGTAIITAGDRTPSRSRAPGACPWPGSKSGNGRNGVVAVNGAQVPLTALIADNGAGVTLVNSTITGNTLTDIQLTFGTRADLRTLVFGSYSCDATVLVRGDSDIVGPH